MTHPDTMTESHLLHLIRDSLEHEHGLTASVKDRQLTVTDNETRQEWNVTVDEVMPEPDLRIYRRRVV